MRELQSLSVVFLFCTNTALPVDDDGARLAPPGYGLSSNGNAVPARPGPTGGPGPSQFGRSGVSNESILWPYGTVPFVVTGPYNSAEEELLSKAMRTIELWTCVRFVPRTGERDYIEVKHIRRIGCLAQAGRVGGRQLMALEAPKCFARVGTLIHELLHVLGVIHEHARTDRDQYVTIYKKNVQPGKEVYFDIYTAAETHDYGVAYDYNSVMHYPEHAYTRRGEKTIVPRIPDRDNSSRIGQRFGLSVRDVIKLNNMYHCYYHIDGTKRSSKVLPRPADGGSPKRELWNTYFRNIAY